MDGDDAILSPEEAAAEMWSIADDGDKEAGGCHADELICRVLRQLGYGDMADAYEDGGFWRA
jgi:hypothetical protein